MTIHTNDSDLASTLRRVGEVERIRIVGLAGTERIYGTYGPGTPRDVLSDLLAGSGYDFMMVGGTAESAPRELLLRAQKGGSPAAPGSAATAQARASGAAGTGDSGSGQTTSAVGRETSASDSSAPQDSPDSSDGEPLGPGAIANPAPQGEQDPGLRMQQRIQQLEQMREQEQQQNPQ